MGFMCSKQQACISSNQYCEILTKQCPAGNQTGFMGHSFLLNPKNASWTKIVSIVTAELSINAFAQITSDQETIAIICWTNFCYGRFRNNTGHVEISCHHEMWSVCSLCFLLSLKPSDRCDMDNGSFDGNSVTPEQY